jgi:transcriptional regulator with XRE-family HTH domain
MASEELKIRTRWAINHVCRRDNLTNKTLADLLKMNTSNISQYRSKKIRPSAEFMEGFCKQFGFSEAWFLSGVGEPFPGAYAKYPEVCGSAGSAPGVREPVPPYGALVAEQKINIEEAIGKAYKILSSGMPAAAVLYLNIQQIAADLACWNEIEELKAQVAALRGQVDRPSASPITTTEPADGSDKEAM